MWLLIVICLVGVGLYFYLKKKKKTDNTGGPCDCDAAAPLVCPPGNGNPLFTGLRVVEMCEVVATPVCVRMLADMGADVIKVERPGKGDLCRTLLSKEFESDRPFGSPFDAINTSKRSIVLNIKQTEDFLKFKALLKDADVFVTNTRYPALAKMGLTYEALKDEFPGLIYAHLSAFGTTGPSATEPGFDTTAFWVGTGLSNSIHREGMYSYYPAGFGDALAGSLLFSGICTALRTKYETGAGMKVDTSLFQTGLYCQSATLCKAPAAERKTPIYENVTSKVTPMSGSYECKNCEYIHIGPTISEKESALEKLETVIPGVAGKSGEALYDVIAKKLKDMDVQDAYKMISGVGVDCCLHNHKQLFPTLTSRDMDRFSKSSSMMKSFAKDVSVIPQLPFDCHCSDKHVPRCRAPYHGQHNEHVEKNGWYPRHEQSVLKTTTNSSHTFSKKPLDGITVVEYSEDDVAASAAAMFAADLGATVIKVEPPLDGDPWRKINPEFFETMNRGKKSVVTEDVISLLENADMFITNVRVSELKSKGLDPSSLSEKYPKLIYGLITPRGIEGPEDLRSDYLIWYGEGGMCNTMEPAPTGYPPQMGSLMTGGHMWAGLSAALFHRDRTGEGQLVDTNQFRSATFGTLFLGALFLRTSQFNDFASLDPREVDMARYFLALASFQCYKTKDGVWIQLIGVDLLKDVGKLLGAFGLWPAVLKGLFPFIYAFATAKGSLFKKIREVGKFLIPIVENKLGEYTFDELAAKLDKDGIWFCKVGVSDQMAYHPQVKFLDLLMEAENGNRILRCPLSVGSLEETALSAPSI